MNIAYFLTPKGSVAYLYEDCTLRQGLEKLRHHGYSAIPVIRRDGSYVGVVREGDFLWQLMGSAGDEDISLRSLEQLQIRDIVHRDHPAVSITVSMEELLSSAATVAFLTEKVEREGISTVFYIEFSNHLVADSIAEAAGARTALFHSCHNVSRQDLESGATYLSLMRQNLETLRACLP